VQAPDYNINQSTENRSIPVNQYSNEHILYLFDQIIHGILGILCMKLSEILEGFI
jgi:hypothetical protein